jgi:hypothetical protein
MNSYSKKFIRNVFSVVIFMIGMSAYSQNILISQGGIVSVVINDNCHEVGGAKVDFKKLYPFQYYEN